MIPPSARVNNQESTHLRYSLKRLKSGTPTESGRELAKLTKVTKVVIIGQKYAKVTIRLLFAVSGLILVGF